MVGIQYVAKAVTGVRSVVASSACYGTNTLLLDVCSPKKESTSSFRLPEGPENARPDV